jgi:uncharacterized protein (DUF1778 family)
MPRLKRFSDAERADRYAVSFRTTKSTHDAIVAAAEAEGCSVSRWMESVIERHLFAQDILAVVRHEIRAAAGLSERLPVDRPSAPSEDISAFGPYVRQ